MSVEMRVLRFSRRFWLACLVIVLLAGVTAAQQGATAPASAVTYQHPPKAVLDVLNAPPAPTANVNPTGDVAMLSEPVRYPPIAQLAGPVLRLAGLRISPATNGPHTSPRITNLTLKRIADGKETKVTLPAGASVGGLRWSPDGKSFLLTDTTANSIDLLIGNTQTGAIRKIAGAKLNAVQGQPCAWLADSKTLLCRLVPAGRGKPPEESSVPTGPNVQESAGRAAPAPTFQDLLKTSHDADLFEYYATAQLAYVDTVAAKATAVGKPAVFGTSEASPDGNFILVARIQRPYSFQRPANAFPREVEVWDRPGRVVYKLASIPLGENVPLGGVATGPRNYDWQPTATATLTWVEALDGGDPRKSVPHRDRVLWLVAPFTGQPAELAKTQHRVAGAAWGERGDLFLLREFDRERLRTRAWFLNPKALSVAPRLVWDLNTRDAYSNPGTPVTKTMPNGQNAILQSGDFIFLSGTGASPQGLRPFLDRFDTKTLKAERLFRSDEKSYEVFSELLASDGSRFLTRRESPTDPPNYFFRTTGGEAKPFTNYADPTPQLRAIKKELVRYKRADGVDLSFTLYLPPDYKPGERRPAVVWAYPLEFTDADVAGQVTTSPNRFTTINGYSHLFFLLAGYVVLDDTTMPVVGDPETVNNTYVEQILSSAKAAIDKADEMGVIDRNRVGVGGHSYGAFMTANLLAHSDLFRAGIARSGAYNRTLTPFGFQSERRTLWQARDMYLKVSPFMYANNINEPILLIHGEADNNTGTFPIQSERMFAALKGNGQIVRYVTLPYEAHGYAARESTEHTLWEMIAWFDRWVKNAPPRGATTAEAKE